MEIRLESSSSGQMGSGFLPLHEGSQVAGTGSANQSYELPERYGVPLLELLVVDPQFVFISWEISPQQSDQARDQFGTDFDNRRLQVSLHNSVDGSCMAERQLYGDVGRWFIELAKPGVWLRAELIFIVGSETMQLNEAGPVFVPRNTPVEPESWEELHVAYVQSDKGELVLSSSKLLSTSPPRLADIFETEGTLNIAGYGPGYSWSGSHQLSPLMPRTPKVEDRDRD